MKTMTCRQLGGACDEEFTGNSFEEIAKQSQAHGREMVMKGDQDHVDAMDAMQELMQKPEALNQWYEDRRQEYENMFDELDSDQSLEEE